MSAFIDCVFIGWCLFSCVHCSASTIGCRDNKGNPVDWFFVYKLPRLSDSSNTLVRNGVGQAYMDVNNQKWTLLGQGVNDTGHAIYNTLQQIYKYGNAESIAYVMYNDEVPGGRVSLNHGHTKGDIAFDQTSGFWLVHSVPKFPPNLTSGYDYPDSGMVYGQSFMCITLNYKYLNSIGQQLGYTYPKIYDSKLPSAFEEENPQMAAALKGKHVTSSPWNNTVTLTTDSGIRCISFAKYSDFGKDLYHDWVAPYLNSDLFVETWQNGAGSKMESDCSGSYKVFNVVNLEVVGQEFKEHLDHSKWAVSTTSSSSSKHHSKAAPSSSGWICVGDINRMETQRKRAGGTVCASLPNVSNNYKNLITDWEKCNQQKVLGSDPVQL